MHHSYVTHLTTGTLVLDTDESLHVNKVLRLGLGDHILLIDGKGSSGVGTITSTAKKNVAVEIKELVKEETNPYLLELAIAPTKGNDRFELVLEKCTELGIRKIHPIISYHSERRKLNLERYKKILISAMKQSQKKWLPEISEPLKFPEFLKQSVTAHKLIAHCNAEMDRVSLKEKVTEAPTLICIGPEGDFSSEEIRLAESHGFTSVHLGNERLRTETAAIFATSIYHTINSL